ncbi:MAG: hypothetical protein AAGF12_12590 [Myxococcota bacterium]
MTELCAFARGAESDHPMPFVAAVESTLVGVNSAGEAEELYRFSHESDDDDRTRARPIVIAVRGDYAAAGIQWITQDAEDPNAPNRDTGLMTFEVVVLDLRTRQVVAQLDGTTPWVNRGGRFHITGAPSGLFVFDLHGGSEDEPLRLGVVSAAWSGMLSLEDFELINDPTQDGVVGVLDRSDESTAPFWLDLCSQSLRPMQLRWVRGDGARVFGNLSEDPLPPVHELAWESPSELGPVMAVRPRAGPFELYPRLSRHLLVDVDEPPDFRLYDVEEGSFDAFRVTVPEGLRRLPEADQGSPYFHNHLSATSDGQVLLGLRNDESAALYSSRDGQAWTPVGARLGHVEHVTGWEVAGTTFVFGSYGLEVGPWPDDPPLRIDGASVQVIRPASGLEILFRHDPPGSYGSSRHRISHDGRCIVWAGGRRSALHVLELDQGQTRDVDLSAFGDIGFPIGAAWSWAIPSHERRL